jgi:CAAX prenyl protease-like protein
MARTPPAPAAAGEADRPAEGAVPAWLPAAAAAAPLLLHLGLASLEGLFAPAPPDPPPPLLLAVHAARLGLVAAVVWGLRRHLRRLAPLPADLRPRRIAAYLLLAALLTAAWVVLDRAVPRFALAGERAGFDPFAAYDSPSVLAAFLVLRFLEMVVVAAVVEELFYRDIALRFVTDPDAVGRVPPGRFSATAAAVSVAFFAAGHPEWLSGAVFAAAMCALLWKTRSLFACVAVHGGTNLLLGAYIVLARDWRLW